MPDIILGIIDGYEVKEIAPFVLSLRARGYNDDVVIFGNDVPEEAEEFLIQHKVRLIRFFRLGERASKYARYGFFHMFKYCGKFFPRLDFPFRRQIIKFIWDCQSSRFFFYEDFLRKNKSRYENVLICDIRDVVFQRHPFTEKISPGVFLFEEYGEVAISGQQSNYMWINMAFGKHVLSELAEKPVICSGVVLGTCPDMRKFLSDFNAFLCVHWRRGGFDQAALNYLVYKNRLSYVSVRQFGKGPVINLAIVPTPKIKLGENGEVLCDDNSVCPIIHQYDRHLNLKARVSELYAYDRG